jgi:hypothetical protein
MKIRFPSRRDLISAVNSISKPAIPLTIRERCITSVRVWAKFPLCMPSHILLASAFKRFVDYGITDDILEAFDSMGHITMAIDYYVQGKPDSLAFRGIIRTRTAVQKLVMLLPTAEELELNISASSTPNIYKCCRLTALIFGVAAISRSLTHTTYYKPLSVGLQGSCILFCILHP